jgi:hypothetical protein
LLRTVTVAHKTLDAIDNAIRADQGARFRQLEHELFREAVDTTADAFRSDEDGFRSHLGASILGGECARHIWYAFRWVTQGNFDGRTLRLFNRGHLEEPRFIAMLKMVGVEVWQYDVDGKQFRISWAEGHAGGSGDGVGRTIPDLDPMTAAICEFKTHGEKSFIELAGKLPDWRAYREDPTRRQFPGQGVRIAKFEHFVQMQTYMRKMGLAAALYMAVCKNTDDLYAEIVTLDIEFADQFLDRGEKLVWLETPPKRISESPGFWKCRFCDDRPVCHLNAAPAVNCRTCRFSKPGPAASWHCTKFGCPLSKELQLTGCQQYERNPAI